MNPHTRARRYLHVQVVMAACALVITVAMGIAVAEVIHVRNQLVDLRATSLSGLYASCERGEVIRDAVRLLLLELDNEESHALLADSRLQAQPCEALYPVYLKPTSTGGTP